MMDIVRFRQNPPNRRNGYEVAHEGSCRQGDLAGRAPRGPGAGGDQQATSGRDRRAGGERGGRRRLAVRRGLRRRGRVDRQRRRDLPDRRRDPDGHQALGRGGERAQDGPGGHRHARPAGRPRAGRHASRPGSDRDQPGRAAAHAVPYPADGRPQLPVERGRLQGGPGRRRRVRPVLPDADHRGGHRQARQGARARHRSGRLAGDRHRETARRGGQRLRRAARVEDGGRVARGHVRRADLGRIRGQARAATPGS